MNEKGEGLGDPLDRFHDPVLLEPVLQFWIHRPDGRYVDATAGDGGHTRGALQLLNGDGQIICLDRDPSALTRAAVRLGNEPRVLLRNCRYDELGTVLAKLGWGPVDGILADLGISSQQVDSPERGFSFRFEGPLDMRMDPTRGPTAADWLAGADEEEIARVFYEYGEAHRSRQAARSVVRERERRGIRTTTDLARALAPVARGARRNSELARYFQAIRIQVNDELGSLNRFLESAPEWLKPGGRLVVLAYHSLEDRRIKQLFKTEAWEALTRKAVQGRTDPNPRARSARLRAAARK